MRYILLPLAMVFVVVMIIVVTVKGIELPVTNRWEVVIIAKYANWVAERVRKSSKNTKRKIGK